ncbi:TPA: ATP-binding cassette domain-containing protein, partial [Escherichia coli]|nr:ABC transporter ATP-binding protein/permease [Escherichia coli]EIV7042003.1 ABC transporter ATP-binding protein/permease [Escherichia coli]EKU6321751.1 ABC transporter ATP-binding protein/permease [Escherichia coli]EKX1214958.1 ABC transporter ATP-binding protein/permease [Escherichia coli]
NLSWFIYKYDELAELAAVIDRLYEFHQLTEQRPTNKPKNCQHAVQVANASIRTPDNKIILENLNFHVSPGKWLLLKGYSGAGKTTLLKTLSHCWPWFKGDISSPADSWYVSQTPLIKSGLLKEIICKALPLPVDDKSLSEVLHQVGLGKLAARIHEHDRWGDILSSGEKQRIALARLILRRPKWIFLDETTSHLEEQEAIRLLRLVREKLPTSGVIMVTHQPGVWNLADDICDISTVL